MLDPEVNKFLTSLVLNSLTLSDLHLLPLLLHPCLVDLGLPSMLRRPLHQSRLGAPALRLPPIHHLLRTCRIYQGLRHRVPTLSLCYRRTAGRRGDSEYRWVQRGADQCGAV